MYSLFINNKHGTLVYNRNFSSEVQLSANDEIRLASTFHGLSTVAEKLCPYYQPEESQLSFLVAKGINFIESDNFQLVCFQSLTGLKFFITAEPSFKGLDTYLYKVYEMYTDYVLKNPFYELDMPIRCELFDKEIQRLFSPLL